MINVLGISTDGYLPFSAIAAGTNGYIYDDVEPPVVLPQRNGGGLRQVILKQEERRNNDALAIFLLDG